jgi:protein-arginine kinase
VDLRFLVKVYGYENVGLDVEMKQPFSRNFGSHKNRECDSEEKRAMVMKDFAEKIIELQSEIDKYPLTMELSKNIIKSSKSWLLEKLNDPLVLERIKKSETKYVIME